MCLNLRQMLGSNIQGLVISPAPIPFIPEHSNVSITARCHNNYNALKQYTFSKIGALSSQNTHFSTHLPIDNCVPKLLQIALYLFTISKFLHSGNNLLNKSNKSNYVV